MANFSLKRIAGLIKVNRFNKLERYKMNSSIDQDPNRTLTLILYVLYIVAILQAAYLRLLL